MIPILKNGLDKSHCQWLKVRNHLKEMLESGTISPSQSAWCNTVVLVQKKDSGLCFCIDFHHQNTWTKKIPTPS